MASLRDIRKRIRSVKSSEKITKAMKMVAAAKLRRAQDEVKKSRPYATKLGQVIAQLAKRVQLSGEAPHPLLAQEANPKRVEILVLTSDRGLCGAFNSNVIRRSQRLAFDLQSKQQEVRISTLGKKGYDVFRRDKYPLRKNHAGVLDRPNFAKANEIAQEIAKAYVEDELDAVWLVYNEFKSAISQNVVVKQLLPVVPAEVSPGDVSVDYLYEPGQTELLDQLLPRYFATELLQAFVESVASEHGARMTAMDNATRNAKEMISSLTLQYNRARQAAITKELMEIIGGSEALAA